MQDSFELRGSHLIFGGPLLVRTGLDSLALRIDLAGELICVGKQRALRGGARAKLPA